MNKKLFIPVFIIMGLGLVSAITYFALFSATINVTQAIVVSGDVDFITEDLFSSNVPQMVSGGEIMVSNLAPTSRDLVVSQTEDSSMDISTVYMGQLELSQKVVDFGLDVWEIRDDGLKAMVTYTMVGDSFMASVEGFEDYSLIYYKDNSDRFNSPAEAILVGDVVGNLPYENDKNADEHNYCDTGEYATCHGAKVWLVPSDALTGTEIDWSRADEFLFETSLIQFNSEGMITLFGTDSISVFPEYTIAPFTTGQHIVTTQIA